MGKDIENSFLVNTFIAHRGFHNKQNPENTLGAMQRAIDFGYAIEVDIHQISDGNIIAIHDFSTKRVADKDKPVKDLRTEELQDYKIMSTEYTIPTLKEVLSFVNGRVPILFEFKYNKKNKNEIDGFCEEFRRQIGGYSGVYAVQSFYAKIMLWFKDNMPKVFRGQLSYFFDDAFGRSFSLFDRAIDQRLWNARKIQPDFFGYDVKRLPNKYAARVKGVPILGWTVRSQKQYDSIKEYVDNIIFEGFEPKR